MSVDHRRKRTFTGGNNQTCCDRAAVWPDCSTAVRDRTCVGNVINSYAVTILHAGLPNVERCAHVVIPVTEKMVGPILGKSWKEQEKRETDAVFHRTGTIS